MTAGGVQHWLVDDQDGVSAGGGPTTDHDRRRHPAGPPRPTASDRAAARRSPRSPSPLLPPPSPATSWTWDPAEGLDREAADPGALHRRGPRPRVTRRPPSTACSGACREHLVPRFESGDLAEPGRLAGDAMPERPAWVAPDDRVIWAPAVARVGDGYVLWFAATSRPAAGPAA